MSTYNIGFYEDLTKLSLNYHQILSNTHLSSSTEGTPWAFQYNYFGVTSERRRSRDAK